MAESNEKKTVVTPDQLGEFRQMDRKNERGKVAPENQTMNTMRVRMFLELHGFTAENFEEKYRVQTAIDMLSLNQTPGEQRMLSLIKNGQNILMQIGLETLMERADEASFRATLERELKARNMQNREDEIIQAYRTYRIVRNMSSKSLVVTKNVQMEMDRCRPEFLSKAKDKIGDILGNMKENFANMSLLGKGVVVAGAIGLTLYVINSEDENIKKIRDTIWGVGKMTGIVVGGSYLLDKGYELFTGKSLVGTLYDWACKSAGKPTFWKETFNTEQERADILRKSIPYLGDKDFAIMVEAYKKGKGNKKVDLRSVMSQDMSQEEIYIAMETFFGKYPLAGLEEKYKNYRPQPTWLDVVSAELATSGELKFESEGILRKTYQAVESGAAKAWDWLWHGEGMKLMRKVYKKATGKEAQSDAEVIHWGKTLSRMENAIEDDRFMDDFISRNFDQVTGEAYRTALSSNVVDAQFPNIKSVRKNGKIYVISRTTIVQIADDKQSIGDAITASHDAALAYIKTRYPQRLDIPQNTKINAGVRVKSNSSYVMLLEMPE